MSVASITSIQNNTTFVDDTAKCGIYGLQSRTTKKWYIGQSKSISSRWESYKKLKCKKQRKLYQALLKYGYDDFDTCILEECDYIPTTLTVREDYYIDKYDSIENGYNIRRADTRLPWSVESRKRLSDSLKRNTNFLGKSHSKETRDKMSVIAKNIVHKPLTEEHKRNIGLAHLGTTHNVIKRWKLSDETKAKIKASWEKRRLTKMTDETKAKISAALSNKKLPDETRRKMALAQQSRRNKEKEQNV